jgi:cytidine deaminase
MKQYEKLLHMNAIALASRENAYCPYSAFAVGSCVLGADGKFYSGCNVENAVDAVCAERTALLKMV